MKAKDLAALLLQYPEAEVRVVRKDFSTDGGRSITKVAGVIYQNIWDKDDTVELLISDEGFFKGYDSDYEHGFKLDIK